MKNVLMLAGLVLMGVSFFALERGWWVTEALWIVDSPVAAGVGALGLALFGIGIWLRRREMPDIE